MTIEPGPCSFLNRNVTFVRCKIKHDSTGQEKHGEFQRTFPRIQIDVPDFWHLVDAETNEGAVNIAPASIRDARLDDPGKLIGTPGQCPHHPDDLFFKGV
ncbi:MAG: hypothetical protein PHO08_00455 [Methylococcales bacterium]|nr:hypothetical protein [Methylococcales bacterium]